MSTAINFYSITLIALSRVVFIFKTNTVSKQFEQHDLYFSKKQLLTVLSFSNKTLTSLFYVDFL